MYLRSLKLRDFRSWRTLEVELKPGVTVFVGRNGHGKTNIVEAIGYLAHLSSHRVSNDAPMVHTQVAGTAPNALISGTAVRDRRELSAHLLINASGANKAQINRTKLRSPRELLGVVKTVLFAPEDLALVRGEPAERRAYLDSILASRQPRIAGVRLEYDKHLRQRNALLKQTQGTLRRGYDSPEGAAALATLDVWDSQLARVGAQLMAARLDLVGELAVLIPEAYASIAPESRPASVAYRSSWDTGGVIDPGQPAVSQVEILEAAFLQALSENRQRDIDRGTSLIGPHRDDLDLNLGIQPAKGFASHGESWSYALSLRLAEFRLLRADGTDPILILDDVFAELDAKRREALVAVAMDAEQVIITAAVGDDLPGHLVEEAKAQGTLATHLVVATDDETGRFSTLDPEENQ